MLVFDRRDVTATSRRCCLRLSPVDAGGHANFDPRGREHEQEVGELAERQHRTAEDQAERSADVAHQRQRRVGRFALHVRVLQLREKHLAQSVA